MDFNFFIMKLNMTVLEFVWIELIVAEIEN